MDPEYNLEHTIGAWIFTLLVYLTNILEKSWIFGNLPLITLNIYLTYVLKNL